MIQLQTQLRQLSGELLMGDGIYFKDMVPELNQIQKHLQASRTSLDLETCLWHMWVILEEILDKPNELNPSVKPTILQRLQRIQAIAFRLSQRQSFVGAHQHKTRAKSPFVQGNAMPAPMLAEKRPGQSRRDVNRKANAVRG